MDALAEPPPVLARLAPPIGEQAGLFGFAPAPAPWPWPLPDEMVWTASMAWWRDRRRPPVA